MSLLIRHSSLTVKVLSELLEGCRGDNKDDG